MAKSLFVILYSALIWCCCTIPPSNSLQNVTDRLALISFKKAIEDDPFGVLASWNDSTHYCQWQGVKCNQRHRDRVESLVLMSQGLVGSLSPHIGNLSFLRTIVLQNNSFYGKIPQEVGRLFRLQTMEFSNNSFSGEIPTRLSNCTKLGFLNLADNKLHGEIPMELGFLSNLEVLYLFKNNLSGNIPPILGNLTSLVDLSLSENDFTGPIPEEFSRLKHLRLISIYENNLVGEIPSGLYNISAIHKCDISYNQLHGTIPSDIGITLPNLKFLNLAFNLFTGKIPISLSNASRLEDIGMTHNNFTGPIPDDFGLLPHLANMDFSINQLNGDLNFLTSLTNCTNLLAIGVSVNFLHGSLPDSVANLSNKLLYFSVLGNQLDSTIPSGFGNLVNLRILLLSRNFLTGPIPSDIGKLHKLERLSSYSNKLIGEIPLSFGNLTTLTYLYLALNYLHGSIPPSLGNCRGLLELYLSHNNLTGSIPPEVMSLSSISIRLDLSRNALSGTLPSEVSSLENLVLLDLSDNRLSGLIPNSLGKCQSLEQIYLQGNSFEGNLPQGLSGLKGLRELDISRNNLSGQIPESLAKLAGLTHLNLSFNMFKGNVPTDGIFLNFTAISIAGNDELCGGARELNLRSCPNSTFKKQKISHTARAIILVVVAVSCLISSTCLIILWRRRRISKRKAVSTPSLRHQFLRVSYAELFKATNGFAKDNMIGRGSYGTVYKGVLDQYEPIVAVKVLNLDHRGAFRSFMSECQALRNTRHRNLLKQVSVCSSVDFQGNDFKAIVYEYMPNGSLEKWLHPFREEENEGQEKSRSLRLVKRLNIAIDIGYVLEYLHSGCSPPIVHGDLKPSNVLLDEEMTAYVGDFGLARILSTLSGDTTQHSSNSIAIKGTIGYVPPEYGMTQQVLTQGDVYSYGVLLLELFTGKKPTDVSFQGDLNLHIFVERSLPDRAMDIVDPTILSNEGGTDRIKSCIVNVLRVGVACSSETPQDRMKMGEAVRELLAIKRIYERN